MLLSWLKRQNNEIGPLPAAEINEQYKDDGAGDYHDLIYRNSPGLQDSNYIQPSWNHDDHPVDDDLDATNDLEEVEKDVQEVSETNDEDDLSYDSGMVTSEQESSGIKKGSSNFVNIRPNQGSLYTDHDLRSESNNDEYQWYGKQDTPEYEYPEEQHEEEDYAQFDLNATGEEQNEYEEEEYEEEEYHDEGQDEGQYGEQDEDQQDMLYEDYSETVDQTKGTDTFKQNNERFNADETETQFNRNPEGAIPDENIDPTFLEKENPGIDENVAKFGENELKEKAEALIKQRQKSIDSKFLKDLVDVPISKTNSFNSKQEQHSPYSFTGKRLSHYKPFRSFKEFLEKNDENVKLVSSTTSHDDEGPGETNLQDSEDIFYNQRISKNAPPSDPDKFNNEGAIEEDIVKGIPKKIKSQVVRLPHNSKAVTHKIKNKII